MIHMDIGNSSLGSSAFREWGELRGETVPQIGVRAEETTVHHKKHQIGSYFETQTIIIKVVPCTGQRTQDLSPDS